MIYLCHDQERAVCETEQAAARLKARGYVRCSKEVHRTLWRRADQITLLHLYVAALASPDQQDQAASTAPSGWKVYHV